MVNTEIFVYNGKYLHINQGDIIMIASYFLAIFISYMAFLYAVED